MKKILVFGRGKLYHEKRKALFEKFNIIGFLDNAVNEKEIDIETGLPVFPPENLYLIDDCDILVVSVHFIDMWKQLMEIGVEHNRILFALFLGERSTLLENDLYTEDAVMTSQKNGIRYESKSLGINMVFSDIEGYKSLLRKIYDKKKKEISYVRKLPLAPVSNVQGLERGKPIDRYYIEKFLNDNSKYIQGICMEVADDYYIRTFGKEKVKKSIISHVKGWGEKSLKINFETGEGVKDNFVDCLIFTQVMQYIYDVKKAFINIYRILKPGGVALITLPGIKSLSLFDDENWGEKWSFTPKSAKILCDEVGENIKYEICSYGNVKMSVAYLYGLCVEDLNEEDFKYNDPQYPFLISIKIYKKW